MEGGGGRGGGGEGGEEGGGEEGRGTGLLVQFHLDRFCQMSPTNYLSMPVTDAPQLSRTSI